MSFEKKSEYIWMSNGAALGDVIASLQVYLHYSIKNEEITRMSLYYIRDNGSLVWYKNKVFELYSLLESPGILEFTEEKPTHKHFWKEGGSTPYFSTKLKWKIENLNSNKVCYQFDGKSHKQKNFPSKEKEDYVLNGIIELGLEPVRLGSHLSLLECVKLLSECRGFIGVDSGMMHLAQCARTPIFLARNGYYINTVMELNENKHFILLDNEIDTLESFKAYIKNGTEYYKSNCKFPERFEIPKTSHL